MTTYYKAVRPSGHDFNTGTIDYLAVGVIRHPRGVETGISDAYLYLSVSTSPTDCTGFSWPARLLEVEAVGEVWTPHVSSLPNKRAVLALRVIRELDAALLFGNHGSQVQAIVERSKRITYEEARGMAAAGAAAGAAARDAAWDAARYAARYAAWAAARDAARYAARYAAWDAARYAARYAAGAAAWDAARYAAGAAAGALTRDLIGTSGYTQENYDLLTTPWRKTIGPIHPDDVDLRAVSA